MGIRLVRDDGEMFWFTATDWKRLLRFAGQYGWKWDRQLIPERWEGGAMNYNNEFTGCAHVERDAARLLADAVERGASLEPQPAFLLSDLERTAAKTQEKLPDYDPRKHASDIVVYWMKFQAFARQGSFRIDLTD